MEQLNKSAGHSTSSASEAQASKQAPRTRDEGAGAIFTDIALAAFHIDMLIRASTEENADLTLDVVRDLVCRIGALADFGAQRSGATILSGEGVHWLLTPKTAKTLLSESLKGAAA